MNTINWICRDDDYYITLDIDDEKGNVPKYEDEIIFMLGKEILIRADNRGKILYPFIRYGKDRKGVTGKFVIGNGSFFIKMPFVLIAGDNQEEFNKVIDKFIIIPYLKMMIKFYGLI